MMLKNHILSSNALGANLLTHECKCIKITLIFIIILCNSMLPFICRSQGTLQAFINFPNTPLREVNIIILLFTGEAIEADK